MISGSDISAIAEITKTMVADAVRQLAEQLLQERASQRKQRQQATAIAKRKRARQRVRFARQAATAISPEAISAAALKSSLAKQKAGQPVTYGAELRRLQTKYAKRLARYEKEQSRAAAQPAKSDTADYLRRADLLRRYGHRPSHETLGAFFARTSREAFERCNELRSQGQPVNYLEEVAVCRGNVRNRYQKRAGELPDEYRIRTSNQARDRVLFLRSQGDTTTQYAQVLAEIRKG